MPSAGARPDAARHPRILISAYACGPEMGPEAGAGWMFARAAAETGDVWIITRERFREPLRRIIGAEPALASRMKVISIDLSPRMRQWKHHPGGIYWYYALWQRLAGRTARVLQAEIGFDVVHHVTFANDWLPCGVARLGPPLVWGPVGGASPVPIAVLGKWLGLRGTLTELARVGFTWLPRRVWGDGAARRSSMVVAQNPDVAHRFRRLSRVVVEPNAAFAEEVPVHRGSTGRGRLAVFAGRLLAWKGAALAVETIARPEAEGWRLKIIGEGYERSRIERLSRKLGVTGRVELCGRLPRDLVLETLAGADALLFPSMHDQAGWIVGEASAMGLPVVCLDLGGPPTLADVNGHVVKVGPALPRRLAEALRDNACSPGVRHSRWDAARLVDTVRDWYLQAMAGPPGDRPGGPDKERDPAWQRPT